MGASLCNLAVLGASQDQIVDIIRRNAEFGEAYVSPLDGKWLTVLCESVESLFPESIEQCGAILSKESGRPTMALLVHDSDFFWYWLWEAGELIDHFQNGSYDAPGLDAAQVDRHIEVLARVCGDVDVSQLRAALVAEEVFAEDVLRKFAGILGVPHAELSMHDVIFGDNPAIPGFAHVPAP